ncbi:hypothetical protein sos41_18370 [Alphaproteobacteria bacterium SO-S41]|nr:hypothetical protein sos41_18370 [Alphaproteobacteria bacterium SO-S41]
MIALALFAAVLRALVPQGFMLSAEGGEPSIVICTADGMRTVTGEPTDKQKPSDVLAGMNAPCAFAGLGAMAPPPVLHVVAVEQAIRLVLLTPNETPRLLSSTAFRLQAPRAPPSLHA